MTDVAHLLTSFVEQFRGERTCTYASAVCLDDTEHVTDLVGTDAQTDAGASADGVGRSHEWIRTKVDVKHCTLSTFTQHRLALLQKFVDFVL